MGSVTLKRGNAGLFMKRLGKLNADGQVMKLDSNLGYSVNRYLDVSAGVPLYFVNGPSSSTGTSAFVNGIGTLTSI